MTNINMWTVMETTIADVYLVSFTVYQEHLVLLGGVPEGTVKPISELRRF